MTDTTEEHATPKEIIARTAAGPKYQYQWENWTEEASEYIEALTAAGYAIVPSEPTHIQISDALGSSAPPPDETPILLDLLDFGGENAARRAVRAAYRAMIGAKP